MRNKAISMLLTSEDRRFQAVLQERDWHITKKVVAVVLGQPATILSQGDAGDRSINTPGVDYNGHSW